MRRSCGWMTWVISCGVLSTFAAAQGPDGLAQIERLAWMAGSWSGTKDGVTSEEHWTTPAGGGLVGMHKDVRDGRMTGFEFLRVDRQAAATRDRFPP